ncbi:Lethal [Trichoderma lentiforme]|uniref:Lethal n=1 Tax=Trichoderma lentiforme TaxID=1567552 RepID=A0A9P4XC63_9HYPO|nr:Lethal [Trichoderma lentiforme]
MAGFLRGKQAGIQNDLSASIRPELFTPDDHARYGLNSQISCFAYDPVQSLLAIGTAESKFGPGKIYVFGQQRVQKTFDPPRRTSFQTIQFSANRLVSLDRNNELGLWDLDTGERLAAQVIGGPVTSMVTDPMLDWAFIGMQNGDIMAYDLDRRGLARSFRLPNFWKEKDPIQHTVTLVTMSMHPRDAGKLLIGYSHGAVIYTFKQNQPQQFLEYVLPVGAPGGSSIGMDQVRRPRLTHALWHPSGTFVLTAHEDGSLVFWDPKEAKVVMARTLTEFGIQQATPSAPTPAYSEPYIKIAWCCKRNCDDTGLLIAGGQAPDASPKSLTFIELGMTPMYATSTWQGLENHFRGKRHIPLALPPGAQAVDFLLIPRDSPYFGGSQDPLAVIVLLSSGELITLSFPSGYPISPTNQLHPSTFFVHPFVTKFNVSSVDRPRWLSMVEKRDQGEPLLKGGAAGVRPRKRFEDRTIIQTAHADSIIRLYDSGHADQIENEIQLQVDIARALDRFDDVEVTAMSLASTTGEFVVGTKTGEAVVFRWGSNPYYGKNQPKPLDPNPMGLSDISSRAEPNLKEGLQPFVLYEMMQGPITAVQISNVGFAAIGSELGFLTIIDLRGPKIIFQAPMTDFAKPENRKSFLKGHSKSSSQPPKEFAVVIEFGVMTLDDDKYSSICCFVGTNLGKVITMKLLPAAGGAYTAEVAGMVAFDGKVVALNPIQADTGKPALATGPIVAGLREGRQVNGVLVAVTEKEIRILRPAHSKGASKEFGDFLCDSACVAELELQGYAIVATFRDGSARAYSIPGMRDLGSAKLPMIDRTRSTGTIVTQTGDIFAWAGPAEMAVIHVWGTGKPLQQSPDRLINPEISIPPRPTISNLQWISGTQHVSPLDLDLLIGGPNRPPSKRMMEAAAAEQRAARNNNPSTSSSSQEGWGDYLTRQLNERTEKLNLMGDTMNSLQEQSEGWADDVNKFIGRQKRNMIVGGLTSKFF